MLSVVRWLSFKHPSMQQISMSVGFHLNVFFVTNFDALRLDEENVLDGIAGCQELRVLIVEGNPVVEDKNFRYIIQG